MTQTYADLMAMTKTALQALIAPGAVPKLNFADRATVQEHIDYRTSLDLHGDECKTKAASGPGSNPPSPPPPPPGTNP